MTTKSNKLGLKPKQIKLANRLADPGFTGTVTQLCDEIGVARSTFTTGWDKNHFGSILRT